MTTESKSLETTVQLPSNSFHTYVSTSIDTSNSFTSSLSSSSSSSTTPKINLASTSLSPSSLFSPSHAGSQLNDLLETYTGDLSACLADCSNQGVCVLSQEKYICKCNQFRTGLSCQSDTRPCSSNPCLNNGTFSSLKNETSFECICQSALFYGPNCENKHDLCLNNTEICIKNQGTCQMNETQAFCKCFNDYTGVNCEIMSTSMVVEKSIISASSIIAIVVMVSYITIILCFDYTKYCLMKNMRF